MNIAYYNVIIQCIYVRLRVSHDCKHNIYNTHILYTYYITTYRLLLINPETGSSSYTPHIGIGSTAKSAGVT